MNPEIMNYAKVAADTVSVRTITRGTSSDTRRKATRGEKKLVSALIAGTIWDLERYSYMEPLEWNTRIKAAASAAEASLMAFYPGTDEQYINCCDTVYNPIIQWFYERYEA